MHRMLAALSSARCTNEENYQAEICPCCNGNQQVPLRPYRHAPTVAGLATTFGSGAMTNPINEITEHAQMMLLIGTNATEAHPVIGYKCASSPPGSHRCAIHAILTCGRSGLLAEAETGTDIPLPMA